MILEVAPLQVKVGQESEFEASFLRAQRIISAMPGYVSHDLQRCIERPNEYVLLVFWQALEDHEPGFRKSSGYQEWKRLLHHFYEPFPVVSHYHAVAGASSASHSIERIPCDKPQATPQGELRASNAPAHVFRRSQRLAHAVWAAVGIIACLVLALTAQESHPPAVILLPLALVVWAVGHGLIRAVLRLAARGRRGARTATDAQPWPPVLRIAAVGTGVPALVAVVQVVGTVVAGRLYPFHDGGDWAAVLVAWLVHAACFAGLLLRQGWSRLMSATLAFGWASLLGVQVAEQLGPGRPSGGTDILVALVLIALLLALGICLVSSRKARSFLAR